ncbi:MAG TPA: polysaccharide deacetylase family protein [Acidimicrobiales bacterium]|jgi:peptidoglycan/xylan/chitin deacetylase (PgdA/CDA1 family)
MHLALGERRMRSGRAVRLGSERADPSTAQMLWRVNTDRPIVAMTFDDGPDPRYTPAILGLLEDHDTVATFFMQGNHVEAHRDLARQVGERHAIGNHTYTHPNMGSASAAMARDELGRTHEIIERTIGSAPVAFRPPYGSLSGATGMVAADMGYDIVLWSDRMSSRRTPQRNLHALADTVRPGAIVLAHDGGSLPNQAVIDSLPSLLDWFEEKEIELVTVPELVAAESNNGSGYRDRGPSVDPVSDEEPEVATATTIVTTGG